MVVEFLGIATLSSSFTSITVMYRMLVFILFIIFFFFIDYCDRKLEFFQELVTLVPLFFLDEAVYNIVTYFVLW